MSQQNSQKKRTWTVDLPVAAAAVTLGLLFISPKFQQFDGHTKAAIVLVVAGAALALIVVFKLLTRRRGGGQQARATGRRTSGGRWS
jgi:hypothetical protein